MKTWQIIACAMLVLLAPIAAESQNNTPPPPPLPQGQIMPAGPTFTPAMPPSGIMMWYPVFWPLNNRQYYSDELWYAAAEAQTGPLWMNLAFDFPFDAGNTLNFESINLKLNSEPFWVGFTGLELQPSQNWIFYGRLGAVIPRDAEVVMTGTGRAFLPANPSDPTQDSPPNLTPPWIWTAKNFNWWLLEGGVVYSLTANLALEAGFRIEHTDFRMEDPRNYTTPLAGAAGGNRILTQAIICPRI